MKIALASIFLNEAQYLEASIRQHIGYCDKWVLVEGADRRYPTRSVSPNGLSTDGSSDLATRLAEENVKIIYIKHGWAADKCELRNRYAERLHDYEIVIVVDIDEFLTYRSMELLLSQLKRLRGVGVVRIPHIHLWKDANHLITGGYWDVPHDRAYRWCKGAIYSDNHNHPYVGSVLLRDMSTRCYNRRLCPAQGGVTHQEPFFLHYGNCKPPAAIEDKNKYYISRGEDVTRPNTTRSRAAWFAEQTPSFLRVNRWVGPIPEVFR